MGALGAQTSWKLDGRLRFVVQIFDFHSVYGSNESAGPPPAWLLSVAKSPQILLWAPLLPAREAASTRPSPRECC